MRKVELPISEVEAAYFAGATIAEIATKYGTTRSTVQRRLTANGRSLRRKGPRLRRQSIQMPTEPSALGYIAGLLDGEGHLAMRHRAGRPAAPRVSIYSTTAEVINWLQEQMGGGHVRWDYHRAERRGWKPIGTWVIWRVADVRAFLEPLEPILIIKRELAASMLADIAAEPAAQVDVREQRLA